MRRKGVYIVRSVLLMIALSMILTPRIGVILGLFMASIIAGMLSARPEVATVVGNVGFIGWFCVLALLFIVKRAGYEGFTKMLEAYGISTITNTIIPYLQACGHWSVVCVAMAAALFTPIVGGGIGGALGLLIRAKMSRS
ncbi:MAG: hypothetical protein DRN15_07815 [Thermoprotei archaeon]|nr:MAG: hypothetical protein DRN15_07815 [Thermoprotei archaeon]RLF25420.1 MAG: hypothetical protein DRM97_01820 [Thermoprotei archaeon]